MAELKEGRMDRCNAHEKRAHDNAGRYRDTAMSAASDAPVVWKHILAAGGAVGRGRIFELAEGGQQTGAVRLQFVALLAHAKLDAEPVALRQGKREGESLG